MKIRTDRLAARVAELEQRYRDDVEQPDEIWIVGVAKDADGNFTESIGDIVKEPDETNESFHARARAAGFKPFWAHNEENEHDSDI